MKTLLLFISIALFFYLPTVISGKIPIPGDLLISQYKPWQAYSYLGYNPGSYPTKNQFFDAIRQLYPWRSLTTLLLKNGEIPLWNPYNFSGSPLLANHQSSVFYPLSIVFLFFPTPVAWTIMAVLQHLFSSVFMYLYLRKIGLSLLAGILSSISFSYSLFFTAFSQYITIGHTVMWLPLILWSIENLREHRKRGVGILFISCVSMLLAGHIQIAAVILLVTACYALARKTPKIALLTILVSIGATAFQIIPTIELSYLSARTSHDIQYLSTALLLQPYQLLLFLIPDLFGNPATNNYLLNDTYATNAIGIGIVSFILAVIAFLPHKQNQITRVTKLALAITLLITVRNPISVLLYSLPIPILASSSPSNMLFLVSFFMSILAGVGLDLMKLHKLSLRSPIVLLIILLGSAYLLPMIGIPISTKNLLYGAGIAAFAFILLFLSTRLKPLLLVLLVIDLLYFFNKFTPFVPRALVFPQPPIFAWLADNAGLNRFWGYGSASIEANFATQYGLFSPDGYDPLYPKRYGEFLGASSNGNLTDVFTGSNRSDAVISPEFSEAGKKILNVLGVLYILDRTENLSTANTFPPDVFPQVYNRDGWIVYKNTLALPRLFLATSYQRFDSQESFEGTFFDPSFLPGSTLLLEKEPSAACCSGPPGNVTVNRYEESEIEATTTTEGPQLLFLSDTHFPGWRAYIDDKETEVLRAHYAFRAVVVPAGSHTVTFRYEPTSFYFGLKVSMISILAILCVLMFI